MKQLQSAITRNDGATASSLQAEMEAMGGLAKYQEASIQGQSLQRGGDSSRMLTRWLAELLPPELQADKQERKLRLLEVGALRIDNHCSRTGFLSVTRIDLHSQHPQIETQDFMARPIPPSDMLQTEGFDIVSLSLVVNFVSDAAGRGEMLRRVSSFLRILPSEYKDVADGSLPALFLVLPAPCVTNSRYLDEERLESIMQSLGYKRIRRKMSAKLVYYLWGYERSPEDEMSKNFRKEELRGGASRNNFAIVVT
ncbi:MAG: hypothetical protein Q9195_001593 [Heterodermia aff. obscurata]